MATVTGPLLSLEASGKLGGAIVFGKWKGRPTVRSLVIPANPQSPAQTGQRAMMDFLGPSWAPMTAGDKATWQSRADEGQFSPFNAFTQFNLRRWVQFTDPMRTPTQAAGTNPVLGALTVTGGVRQLTISQVITTMNDFWGLIISISTTTGFTPAKTDTWTVRYATASPVDYIATGLTPGTYYVRTAGFTFGGSRTAFVAQQSGVVT